MEEVTRGHTGLRSVQHWSHSTPRCAQDLDSSPLHVLAPSSAWLVLEEGPRGSVQGLGPPADEARRQAGARWLASGPQLALQSAHVWVSCSSLEMCAVVGGTGGDVTAIQEFGRQEKEPHSQHHVIDKGAREMSEQNVLAEAADGESASLAAPSSSRHSQPVALARELVTCQLLQHRGQRPASPSRCPPRLSNWHYSQQESQPRPLASRGLPSGPGRETGTQGRLTQRWVLICAVQGAAEPMVNLPSIHALDGCGLTLLQTPREEEHRQTQTLPALEKFRVGGEDRKPSIYRTEKNKSCTRWGSAYLPGTVQRTRCRRVVIRRPPL